MKNLLVGLILFLTSFITNGQGYSVSVQGSFCSIQAGGQAAPGLMVSFVHPQLGRSAPAYTDMYGNFMMFNIPVMPNPYFIEVYWGANLIYRNTVQVGGPLQLPRVCL